MCRKWVYCGPVPNPYPVYEHYNTSTPIHLHQVYLEATQHSRQSHMVLLFACSPTSILQSSIGSNTSFEARVANSGQSVYSKYAQLLHMFTHTTWGISSFQTPSVCWVESFFSMIIKIVPFQHHFGSTAATHTSFLIENGNRHKAMFRGPYRYILCNKFPFSMQRTRCRGNRVQTPFFDTFPHRCKLGGSFH